MNLLKYRVAQLISSAQKTKSQNQINRRVLMYHSIDDSNTRSSDIYSISKRFFTNHVKFLSENANLSHLRVVALDASEPTGISITFDDGYHDTLTVAAKLLCEKNIPFTVFATIQNMTSGKSEYLNQNQLVELSKMPGVNIGSHGYSHAHLAELSETQVLDELRMSKDWLEQTLSKPVTTMSYPHGSFNTHVVRMASEVGYEFAATSKWGIYKVGLNPLEIPRVDVWCYDDERALQQKLSGKWDLIAGRI